MKFSHIFPILVLSFLSFAGCGAERAESEGEATAASTYGLTASCSAAQIVACAQSCQACSGGLCEATTPAPAGTVCRPSRAGDPSVGGLASNICDPAETCDGVSTSCPADAPYAAMGTACGTGLTSPCEISGAQVCNSTGLCLARKPAMTVCKLAGLSPICDPADHCDGARLLCPTRHAPPNTPCEGGKKCVLNGVCR